MNSSGTGSLGHAERLGQDSLGQENDLDKDTWQCPSVLLVAFVD